MEIRFLGTADGVPRGERFCSCAMLKVNGVIYLIDAGAPIAYSLQKYGEELSSVRAVFLTHGHCDHASELLSYVNLLNWCYKDLSLSAYVTDPRMPGLIDNYIDTVDDMVLDKERIRLHVVSEGEVYRDENIKVTYIKNEHLFVKNRPSYSLLIEGGGKRVVFTGDMSQWLQKDDFPRVALEEETDAVVCEFAHFLYEQAAPYWKRLKTKRLLINHVTLRPGRIEELEKGLAADSYPFPIERVNDGDCFKI